MRLKSYSLLLLLLIPAISTAQSESSYSPISLACGSLLSVPHISDYFAESEAVKSLSKEPYLCAAYKNRLFIPQIGHAALNMVYPSEKVTTSASFKFYGFSEYWNISASIGFSHHFKKYIALGVEAFFYGAHFNTEHSFRATGGVNLSFLVFPTKQLTLGFHSYNISFSTIKSLDGKYRLPVIFRMGISYNFSNKVLIALEGGKELKHPFIICLGVEYIPVRQFILRCGVNYQTTASCSLGFGLRFGRFFLDFGAEYRLVSGLNCSAGLGFTFKGKER